MAKLTKPNLHHHATPNTPPPFLLHIRSSKPFILLTVSLAVFTDIFLYAVIVPVLPFALTSKSSVPPTRVQYWVSVLIAVYGAALLAFSPLCGWYADRTSSRRWPLLLGLVALAGATGLLCVGSSVVLLILGRVFQGVSAAVVWTVGLALLVDTVGERDVGQAMGYVGLAMSMGVLVAPLLGGIVFDKGGYYAVFGMCFGLIAVDIFLRLAMVEKKVAKQWLKNEEGASEVVSPARSNFDEGKEKETFEEPIPDPPAGLFAPQNNPSRPSLQQVRSNSSRASHKKHLPPVLILLRSRRLLAALWGCFVQASLLTSFDSVLPLFVRNTFGWNSIGAGLIFLPLVIPSFLGPVIGWASDRYGPRWLATAGFLCAAPFLVLLRLVTHNSLSQKALLSALLVLIGTSIDLVMSPLMAEITYVVETKEKKTPGLFGPNGAYAMAYGLFNMAFAGGCMVGPIWAGFVQEKAGWGTMTWTLALLSAVSAVPTCLWAGGFITKRSRRKDGEGVGVDHRGMSIA